MQDEADGADDTSVRVAVRVRPQNSKEKIEMNRICTSVADEEKQILLGEDKAFTFDYTFDMHIGQSAIFDSLAKNLIDGCLEGYNATLFAYGQTGSGKTYTMGTGFELSPSSSEAGIIPRAVSYLFGQIDAARRSATQRGLPLPEFKVVAQFLELYNEVLIDLLDVARDAKNKKSQVKIHENAEGGIYITGVSTRVVLSLEDTMRCLQDGALCRSTGSTNMNAQSSRSHAIFTLHIRQKRPLAVSEEDSPFGVEPVANPEAQTMEFETLTAKFHFVDLAGSERLKRTGATGDRAREGISINCGLLALGNVISALGDRTKKGCHVPYRDSKLTRLLQDSLGGNSRTIMVACISPSDCDFMETLNTLKYANRARNIKNKVSINQDKTSKQIAALRAQLMALQSELDDYRTGKRVVLADGSEACSDLHSENSMLQAENEKLRDRIKVLQSTLESIKARNAVLLTDCEVAQSRLRQMDPTFNEDEDLELTLNRLTTEMEDLRTRLAEAEATVSLLQRQRDRQRASAASGSGTSAGAGGHTNRSVAFSASDFPETPNSDEFSSTTFDSTLMGMDSSMTVSAASISFPLSGVAKDSGRTSVVSASTAVDVAGGAAVAGGGSDEEAGSDVEGLEDSEDGEDSEENETEQNGSYLDASLADLQREISQKQRLITEIETKQRQLRAVRDHYEKQLLNLQARIKETEAERDRVLQNLELLESSGEEKVRRVQQEYQNKLQSLQEEVGKLKKASAQHNRLLANQAKKEAELHRMHSELDDLKRTKVTLMQKLRDESKRTQAAEQRHVREMHQLRKEKRQAEGQVRSLQERAKQTEQVLRRKQEEVQSLRRRPTRLVSAGTPSSNSSATAAAASATNSATASGPAGLAATRRRAAAAAASPAGQQQQLSARAMKGRWDSIERALSTTVGRRQTVGHLAADMENWVHEREKLARRLDQLNAKRARFERAGQTAGPDWDQLLEQMRNARAQAELAQDNIAECQRSIIELEEQRLPESSALFGRLTSLQEARYLLERLYQLALDRGLSALQRETELRDARANAEAKAKETEQALEMLQIALKQAPVPGLDADDLFFGVVGGGDGEDGDVDGEAAGGGGGAVAAADDDNEDADSLENGEAGGGGSSSKPAVAPRQQQQQQQMFNLGGAATIDSRPRQIRKFHLEMLNSKRKTATAEELLGLKSAVDMSRSMDEGALAGGALRNNSSESALLPAAGARVPGNASSSAARPKSFRLPVAAAAAAAPPSASQPTTPSSGGGRPLKFPAAAAAAPATAAAPPTSGPAAQRVQQQLLLQQQQQQLLMSRPASKDGMTTSFYIPRQHADIPEVDNASADAESIAVLQQSSASAASAAAAASGVDQNFRRSGSLRSRDAAGQPASMGNVFNRLTSGSVRSSPNIESSKGGSINPCPSSTPGGAKQLLECSHTAEGHTKPVLDLDVRGDRMLTGSKDRTAKLWDLSAMAEIRSLEDHHNNVSKVRYWSAQRLALTVCSFYIKVWDERVPGPCVRTLLSTGLSQAEPPEVSMGLRQNVCPAGETNIMDLALPDSGNAMFLATANSVKVWDLRRFAAVGKLHGSHQAPVMVLACERANGGCQVVTGSKDHYMKVFWVSDGAMGLLTPTADLQPPHYDGIEALALNGSALYSASRDGGLKKWHLGPNCHQVACVNSAHKDWVQGLALSDDAQRLYSACRSGVLKVWDAVGDLTCIGELPTAHNGAAINSVHQCGGRVYTASNDHTVKFWREPMPGSGELATSAADSEGNLDSL